MKSTKLIFGIFLFVGHLQAMDAADVVAASRQLSEAKRVSLLFLDLFFKNTTDDEVRWSVQSNLRTISSSIGNISDYNDWYKAVKERLSAEQGRCKTEAVSTGQTQEQQRLKGIGLMVNWFQEKFGWWMPGSAVCATDLDVARLENAMQALERSVAQRKNKEVDKKDSGAATWRSENGGKRRKIDVFWPAALVGSPYWQEFQSEKTHPHQVGAIGTSGSTAAQPQAVIDGARTEQDQNFRESLLANYKRQYEKAGSNLLKKTYDNLSKRNFLYSVAGVGFLHTIARRPVIQRNPFLHRVAKGMQYALGINGAVQLGMAVRQTHNQVQSARNRIEQDMNKLTKIE